MEGDLEATNHGYSEQTGILPRTAFYLFQEKLKAQVKEEDDKCMLGLIDFYITRPIKTYNSQLESLRFIVKN